MDIYRTKKVNFSYQQYLTYDNTLILPPKEVKESIKSEDNNKGNTSESMKISPYDNLRRLNNELVQVDNISSFKDTYKKLRKLLKENQSLYDNPISQSLLIRLCEAFCYDSFYSDIREIKGLLNDFLHDMTRSRPIFKDHITKIYIEAITKFLEPLLTKIPEVEKETNIKSKIDILDYIKLEKIDEEIKLLNRLCEIINELNENSKQCLDMLMKYHQQIMKKLLTYMENIQYSSIKFLDIFCESMRNCLSVLYAYKGILKDEKHQYNESLLNISNYTRFSLYFINRLNHDTISQATLISIFLDIEIMQMDPATFQKQHFSMDKMISPISGKEFIKTQDALNFSKLAMIKSLAITQPGYSILAPSEYLNGYNHIDFTLESCNNSQAALSHYAFKTLHSILLLVEKNEKIRVEFFGKSGDLCMKIFEILLKNWENPIKGISHQIDEIFRVLLTIIKHNTDDIANKYIQKFNNILSTLNPSHNKRKFLALNTLIDYVDCLLIIKENKSLVYDLFKSSGDTHLQSSVYLIEKLLTKLWEKFTQSKKKTNTNSTSTGTSGDKLHIIPNTTDISSGKANEDFEEWYKYWLGDYLQCLENEEFNVVKGIISYVNPVLCRINKQVISYLIQAIIKKDLTRKNILWCYVSLIKLARDNSLIDFIVPGKGKQPVGYKFKGVVGTDDKSNMLDAELLKHLIVNNNRNIMLDMLDFVTNSPKISEIPAQFEFDFVKLFIQYNLRTSYSDFRNNYIVLLKRFFHRLRNIYDSIFQMLFPVNENTGILKSPLPTKEQIMDKKYSTKGDLNVVLSFLDDVLSMLVKQLHPDASFELLHPVLELVKAVFQAFGIHEFAPKRNIKYQPIGVLYYINAFKLSLHEELLWTLKVGWESVRLQAFDILLSFPDEGEHISKHYIQSYLLPKGIELTKNPVIKNAECGALVLALIFRKYLKHVDIPNLLEAKGTSQLLYQEHQGQEEKQKSQQEQEQEHNKGDSQDQHEVQIQGLPVQAQHVQVESTTLLIMSTPPQSSNDQLCFLYYIVDMLNARYEKIHSCFIVNQGEFVENLLHGLITTLSLLIDYLFDQSYHNEKTTMRLMSNLRSDKGLYEEYQRFFAYLITTIIKILTYATKLSSDNISTCILDNDSTLKQLYDKQEKLKKIGMIDCRGHVVLDDGKGKKEDVIGVIEKEKPSFNEEEENKKSQDNITKSLNTSERSKEFMEKLEQLLQGNVLIDSIGGPADNTQNEFESENIVVVSFYLMTRESGLLFQTLANLILYLEKNNLELINFKELEALVNTYFHSLLNLKHLGSIDRIAQGLSILCKSMYETKNPLLPNLAEKLLEQILNSLEKNDFKNILRRSAGIPPAIVCLLKSEPSGKKSRLFPRTLRRLFELTNNAKSLEIMIHALNILKLIFQDSNLRSDIEQFISQGFITSIKGFSSNDWAIRNSSLMLFSSICKRTLGTDKVADQHSIRNSMNIAEFFTRAPSLFDYFMNELIDFLEKAKDKDVMYPSLYPISLIMSRLLPYDLKNNYLRNMKTENDIISQQQEQQLSEINEGEMDNQAQSLATREEGANNDGCGDDDKQQQGILINEVKKYITTEDINKFLPLLIRASNNKNYMGRLMCAHAILPFIPFDSMSQQIINLLKHENLQSIKTVKRNHNFAHGILLQIYFVLKNHYNLVREYAEELSDFKQNLRSITDILRDKFFILAEVKCPFVPVVYLQIVAKILRYEGNSLAQSIESHQVFTQIYKFCLEQINHELKKPTFRIENDLGHSILRLKYAKYIFLYERMVQRNFTVQLQIVEKFVERYVKTPSLFAQEDNELFRGILESLKKSTKSKFFTIKDETFLISLFVALLNTQEFYVVEFMPCATVIFENILNFNELRQVFGNPANLNVFYTGITRIYTKYPENSRVMKYLVRLYGKLLPLSYDFPEGTFLSEHLLELYTNLYNDYSHADQKDYLRISVIKSMETSLESVLRHIEDIKIFLQLSKVIVRLLQDEIPEIRGKISNFISRYLAKATETATTAMMETTTTSTSSGIIQDEVVMFTLGNNSTNKLILKFNSNYMIQLWFMHILKRYREFKLRDKDSNIDRILIEFLLVYIFESEFDKFKEMAHYEKRIFAFEKPNKFYSDYIIKQIAYNTLIETRKHMRQENILRAIEGYFKSRGVKFVELCIKTTKDYQSNPLDRDELLFEANLKTLYFLTLTSIFNGSLITEYKDQIDDLRKQFKATRTYDPLLLELIESI